MKKLFAIAILLALTACGTPQQTQVTAVQACAAYKAALETSIQLVQKDKLSHAEMLALQKIDNDISPICYAKSLPADSSTVVAQVTAAVTVLTVQIIADKVTK